MYSPKSKKAPATGSDVDQQVAFGQVPAAGPDQQRGRVLGELVVLAVGVAVRDRALDRVAQVALPLDHVAPGRGVGVLEVGHEPVGARVQRVDDHLAVGGAGDLDPALLHVGRDRLDRPVALADLPRVGQEVEQLARPQSLAPTRARLEQLVAAGAEAVLEFADQLERVRGEDLVKAGVHGALELEPGARGHRFILSSGGG